MTVIDFTKENFSKIVKGKRTTIRLGRKEYPLTGVDFTVEGDSSEYTPLITELRYLQFRSLTIHDAVADGFSTIDQLREELHECYGRFVSDFEEVTVVRFEV